VTLMLWLASAQGTPRYPAKRKAQRGVRQERPISCRRAARLLMENGQGAKVHLVRIRPEEISSKHDGGSSARVRHVVKNDWVIVTVRRPISRIHERPWAPRMGDS
jgi:hypothetical protein